MIITIEAAKNYLHVDEDYNDEEIEDAICSAQDYLFNATGKHWEDDVPPNATAVMAVKMQIHMDFYKQPDTLTMERLTAKIKQLQYMA